jgi:hypothetical protein
MNEEEKECDCDSYHGWEIGPNLTLVIIAILIAICVFYGKC